MEFNYPKISIVTPSFNSAKYIEDCIQSVLNQNYPNIEHIIIDGGSSDGTLEILKKYSHLKWISEPDEGQSDALNKGFKMTNGDILGWCNSDDVYLPQTFKKVVAKLINSKYDGVYSNLYFGDEKLNITRKSLSHKPIKWLSLFHCFIPSATFFFKRKIIEAGILIDKTKHITMDKDFFASILYNDYNLKYVNDYFAIFRWHENNKSLYSQKTLSIRLIEGVELLNRFSMIKVPQNEFGYFLYKSMNPIILLVKFFIKLRKVN